MPTSGEFEKSKAPRKHILKSPKVGTIDPQPTSANIQPSKSESDTQGHDLESNLVSDAGSKTTSARKNYKKSLYCIGAVLLCTVMISVGLAIAFGIVVSGMNQRNSNTEATTLAITSGLNTTSGLSSTSTMSSITSASSMSTSTSTSSTSTSASSIASTTSSTSTSSTSRTSSSSTSTSSTSTSASSIASTTSSTSTSSTSRTSSSSTSTSSTSRTTTTT